MTTKRCRAERKARLARLGRLHLRKKISEYKFSRPLGNNCAYLVILISGHSNEIRFRKNISPEGTVREFENIVGPHNVKPGLIFVHRVKNGLQHTHTVTNMSNYKRLTIQRDLFILCYFLGSLVC